MPEAETPPRPDPQTQMPGAPRRLWAGWPSYWEQVRGNAKWDATKTAGSVAVIALYSVVFFLRQGPAWQVYGLMGIATVALFIYFFFGSKLGKCVSYILASAFVLLGILAVTSFYQGHKETAPVVNTDTHGSTLSPVQTMVASPNGSQKITIGDVMSYKSPEQRVIAKVTQNLMDFKTKYSAVNPEVSIQVEAGSTQRRKVAQTLGGVLGGIGLGTFQNVTSVGVAPGHPLTIWYPGTDQSMANDFCKAISPYVSADDVDVCRDDRRFQGNRGVILYINGLPNFEDDGHVTVR